MYFRVHATQWNTLKTRCLGTEDFLETQASPIPGKSILWSWNLQSRHRIWVPKGHLEWSNATVTGAKPGTHIIRVRIVLAFGGTTWEHSVQPTPCSVNKYSGFCEPWLGKFCQDSRNPMARYAPRIRVYPSKILISDCWAEDCTASGPYAGSIRRWGIWARSKGPLDCCTYSVQSRPVGECMLRWPCHAGAAPGISLLQMVL